MKPAALFAALALLAGCSTHPLTGREQMLALPALQAAHAEASYSVASGAQRMAASPGCAPRCGSPEDLAGFAARVAWLGERLEVAAREVSPESFARTAGFRIGIDVALGAATASSAGGRIALGAGLAALQPADTVIAFLIAREMAHVIARHAEENSGASMAFSALGLLLPGISVIARFVATTLGSGVLKASWAVQQRREADEIALMLMACSGFPAGGVALALQNGVRRERVADDDWGVQFAESAARVALIAALHQPGAPPAGLPVAVGMRAQCPELHVARGF